MNLRQPVDVLVGVRNLAELEEALAHELIVHAQKVFVLNAKYHKGVAQVSLIWHQIPKQKAAYFQNSTSLSASSLQ